MTQPADTKPVAVPGPEDSSDFFRPEHLLPGLGGHKIGDFGYGPTPTCFRTETVPFLRSISLAWRSESSKSYEWSGTQLISDIAASTLKSSLQRTAKAGPRKSYHRFCSVF